MTVTDNNYTLTPISIPRAQANQVKDLFYQYASSFRKEDDPLYNEHMDIKLKHTAQVCQEIHALGVSLGMNDEQLAFIEVIAWLHDIGRFEQFDTYGTYADAESENHSEIALRIIENNGILENMILPDKEVVFRAILNHNIPQVPAAEPDKIQFYSRILRDADKLDIWRVSIEMNIFHKIKTESLPDQYEVPHFLLASFEEDKIIHLDHVQSFYDSIIFRISWIYDLNFMYSVRQVLERKVAEKLLAKLPWSASLDTIEQRINRYMKQRIA